MRDRLPALLAMALLLFAAVAAEAQTTTSTSFSFQGAGSGNAVSFTASSSGTFAPFGSAVSNSIGTRHGDMESLSITVVFSNGDMYTASARGTRDNNESSGSGVVTGGTGEFANATGSFSYATVGPSSNTFGYFLYTFTGSGTITTTGAVSERPSALLFSFLQGNTTLGSLPLTLTNGTPQPAAFSATTSGEAWLSVSPATSTVAPLLSTTVAVTVNPASLAPGTYAATVTLSTSGQRLVVPVTVTVSSTQLAIVLSQTALRFQAAAGGGAPPGQSITVLNQGTGALNWSAAASTLVGSWLSVAPYTGAGGDAATVSVDPSYLAPAIITGW